MKSKLITNISMGFLLSCTVISMPFAYAEDYVTKSQINAANGVAGLDSSKQATVDISNSRITTSQMKIVDQYKAPDGSIIERPLVKFVPDDKSAFTLGKEMVQIGGDYVSNSPSTPVPMGLTVLGRPYGNYNAGCTLCVFSSSGGMYGGSGQAAISGIDYRGGANAVANGDMATVGFYHYDENSPARIVAQAASFGPGVVTLPSPMTNIQMSQLRQGMYVATNVIDPNIPTNTALLALRSYRGFIKSWDANHIYVYGWAVLGNGNAANGQVPDVNYLDDQLSSYKVPMIFVGASDKIFAENEYMVADGSRVIGDKAVSVVNKYEREEFDFRAKNWTKPHSLSFHGWTTSFECRPNCDPRAVSEDSYAYLVNGPDGLPRAYVAQTVGDALEFSGYSTFIGGNGGPQSVDSNGNSGAAVKNSNHIMSSFASSLPNSNTIHMSTIVNREVVGTNDWRDYGVRLVMDVDSQRDRKKGLYNGSRMGSIVFNYNASHYGGICLLGYDSNQGLCQEGDGSVNFAKNVLFKAGASFSSGQQIRFLNNTNNPVLTIYSDEGGDMNLGTQVADGANIRNVNGFYGRNLTVTQKISASQLHIQLSTPSSSSASCSAGDIKDDANYHYVCVATNKWKRVALSDF